MIHVGKQNGAASLPSTEQMYRACLERDSSYEGVFVMAVRTTGIFCRPTCHARKPKRENVEFFAAPRDALAHGYRPCLVCRPLEPVGTTPDWVAKVLDEVRRDPAAIPSDTDLREQGVDPARLRRWFKKNHGMTFRAYLRHIRLNEAFGAIRAGEPVIEAAIAAGYDSLSGFGESFRRNAGFVPSESKAARVITIARILTPLGPMVAGALDDTLVLLEFADRRMLPRQIEILERRLNARATPGDSAVFASAERQLGEYFDGQRRQFDLPVETVGTAFQKLAWSELGKIPYGETRSYAQQAAAAGRPTAVRAIGRANGENRIAIIVPCHRVVGADGTLTGYGGGVWRKRRLLELEQSTL